MKFSVKNIFIISGMILACVVYNWSNIQHLYCGGEKSNESTIKVVMMSWNSSYPLYYSNK